MRKFIIEVLDDESMSDVNISEDTLAELDVAIEIGVDSVDGLEAGQNFTVKEIIEDIDVEFIPSKEVDVDKLVDNVCKMLGVYNSLASVRIDKVKKLLSEVL